MRHPWRVAPVVAAVAVALQGCDGAVDPVAPVGAPVAVTPVPRTAVAASTHPGSWTPKFTWPTVGVHLIVLPNGKVLTWSSSKYDYAFKIENVFLWDPATWSPMGPGPFTLQENGNTDLFCASHNFEADGTLFITGGHAAPDSGDVEVNRYRYDGAPTWSLAASMTQGARWYPTSVTLPNGQSVTMGGTKGTNNWNNVPELWDGTSWRALPGATLQLPWYPWAFVAPNGLVFVAGSDSMSRYLDVSGVGKWTNVGLTQFGRPRDRGSAVMYEPGKVLIFGGGGSTLSGPAYVGATNTAETIDLNAVAPAWKYTGSMSAKRRHVNSAMLADGKVLAMGGTTGWNFDEGDVKTVEMWDPATGVWTRLDSTNVVPRAYHGSAVLLPDARVLVAGSGRCPGCAMVDQLNAQIFTPPYLYQNDGTLAPRPTITAAPTAVSYGQTFSVATPDAPSVAQVTWVRLPAMTHSFDMNTRFMRLPFSGNAAGSTQLSVTAPINANISPPGHYLLFVLNGSGVPSVARVVQIGGTPAPPPPAPPAAPTALSATAAGSSQVNLAWTDNASNETGVGVERCVGATCTSFAQIAVLAANATSYQDAGLTPSTTYSYRVRSSNGAGYSDYSNRGSATTSAAATGIVLSASGSKVKGLQKVNLTWTGTPMAATAKVTVTRTGTVPATLTLGDTGSHLDPIDQKGGGSYTYKLCEAANPARCSNSVTVVF